MLLEQFLDKLYDNCYECSRLQRLPRTVVKQESKAEVEHPHTYFHADVVKRAGQKIFLLVDHFSSAQSAILVPSEKAADLKQALLILLQSMRKPGWIEVNVDNAKGFESLVKQQDSELTSLKIKLALTDVFNKNANSVVDKACQELEEELRKVSPGGTALTQAQLSQAVMQVNQKMRRGGGLSSHEISTSRDMHTGQNLQLQDDILRQGQLQKRVVQQDRHGGVDVQQAVQVGDRVAVRQQQDKHKARDVYRVTSIDKEDHKIGVQKEWHGKLRNKVYQTDEKRLVVLGQHSSHTPTVRADLPSTRQMYDPVNKALWEDEDDIYDEAPASLWQDGVQFERQPVLLPLPVQAVVDVMDQPEVIEQLIVEEEAVHNPIEGQVEVVNVLPEVNVDGGAIEQAEVEDDLDYDQSRKPRKGDVISYGIEMATEHERWAEARITTVHRRWPDFYNVQRLDTNERLGVFLYPGQAWHLGPRLEQERAPQLHPASRETSPILLRREEREFRYEFELDHLHEPPEEAGGLGDSRQ